MFCDTKCYVRGIVTTQNRKRPPMAAFDLMCCYLSRFKLALTVVDRFTGVMVNMGAEWRISYAKRIASNPKINTQI